LLLTGEVEAEKSTISKFLKIGEVTTGYPSHNDLPGATVKKNPSKQIFSTPSDKRNRVFPSTEIVYIIRALSLYIYW
jgi:hypothetical protein